MGMSAEAFWLTPIGFFMDLWECHKQFLGMAKPRKQWTIDIIPLDI